MNFTTLEAAQRWRDTHVPPTFDPLDYERRYGVSALKCVFDCFVHQQNPIRLRMAAHRLSNALNAKMPENFAYPKAA